MERFLDPYHFTTSIFHCYPPPPHPRNEIKSAQLACMDCPYYNLDFFKTVRVQIQVKQYSDVKFLPMVVIQENAPISHHVPKSSFYTDPRQMYFVTVVEIMNGNNQSLSGKSFTNDSDPSKLEKVGVIDYPGEALWQQMDFRINNTPINLSYSFYHQAKIGVYRHQKFKKTPYFQQFFADFSRKHGIITALRFQKFVISYSVKLRGSSFVLQGSRS